MLDAVTGRLEIKKKIEILNKELLSYLPRSTIDHLRTYNQFGAGVGNQWDQA